jgi:hypothetical protein
LLFLPIWGNITFPLKYEKAIAVDGPGDNYYKYYAVFSWLNLIALVIVPPSIFGFIHGHSN